MSAQNNLQAQCWGDDNPLVSTDTGAVYIATDSRNGVGCPAATPTSAPSATTRW